MDFESIAVYPNIRRNALRGLRPTNYRPWGLRNTKSADMQTDPLAYTAQPFDDETSLLYLGARYHHVKIGRFYQMDPVHFTEDNSHSFNRFAYANNNPYKFVDPDGLSPEPHDNVAYRQLGADQGSLGTEGRGLLFGGLAGAVGLAAIPARVLGAALVAGGPSLDLATMASGEPPLMGPLGQVAKSVTRFKHGDLFEHTIQTKQGPVDFLAETVVKGDTLILKDVAVFGRKGDQALTGLQKDIFRGATELKQFAREQGFKRLEITGKRVDTSSSVRPGHDVNLGWDL